MSSDELSPTVLVFAQRVQRELDVLQKAGTSRGVIEQTRRSQAYLLTSGKPDLDIAARLVAGLLVK